MAWIVLLLLLVAAFVAFIVTARRGAVQRANDPTESMDADSRSLFLPIRRLVDQIEEVATRQDSVTGRVVGTEAMEEAKRIREQCAKALVARSELKKAGRGKGLAENEVSRLEEMEQSAATDSEKAALASAREARKLELTHYVEVEDAIKRIDGGIRQAEAALSEMKTRLAVAAGSEKAELAGDDELRETIGRLKSLSVSYDEAEQTLRGL